MIDRRHWGNNRKGAREEERRGKKLSRKGQCGGAMAIALTEAIRERGQGEANKVIDGGSKGE